MKKHLFIFLIVLCPLIVFSQNYFVFSIADGIMPSDDGVFDIGSAAHRWKDVWASNGTIQTSDSRIKNTVQNSEYGLDAVLNMRPVTFYWNDNREQGRKVGLIAQEVQEVVSEVVYDKTISIDAVGNKTVTPTALLGLNYAELVPVLIKAIQEQQVMIEKLNSENEELNMQGNELALLKSEVAQLKAMMQQIINADTE